MQTPDKKKFVALKSTTNVDYDDCVLSVHTDRFIKTFTNN